MLKTKFIVVSAAVLVTGCTNLMETMFFHYTLSDGFAKQIAQANAGVNFCLAQNSIDKNLAYAFSNVSAQILDITVLDRTLYKERYEQFLGEIERRDQAATDCAELNTLLPRFTQSLMSSYADIANQLRVGRAQEQQQMASMMSNFGSNWAQQNYAMTYSWPRVNYVEKQSEPTNYLVNTSKGLVQCRTTNKNYVFCM